MTSLTNSLFIPPPLSTSGKRDSNYYDNARVTILANNTLTQDDAIEHGYEELEHTYNTDHILYYDLISLGFESTAQILAREISSDFAISSYLDLGTGSGLTARACIRQLPQLGADSKIVIVDGLEGMLTQAKNKLELALNVADIRAPERLLTYIGDVTALPPAILQDTQNKWGFATFSLLTAQRVLINIKKDRRVEVLRHWKSYLSQGGKLVVDVPHPRRNVSAVMLGPMVPKSNQPTRNSGPGWDMCRWFAEDVVWEECRSYARDLARDAGLMITNDIPKALPRCEMNHDGRPAYGSWFAGCRATTLRDPLTPSQRTWFNNRYCMDAIKSYQQYGVRAQPEIAAVIVVLEHLPASAPLAPNSPVPGPQAHTKYEIDETLHGEARRKAIKQAAKREKKENARKP